MGGSKGQKFQAEGIVEDYHHHLYKQDRTSHVTTSKDFTELILYYHYKQINKSINTQA